MRNMVEPTKDELMQGLLLMRSLIAKGWCQKSYARKKDGSSCHMSDPNACQWCLCGTLILSKMYSTQLSEAMRKVLNQRMEPNLIAKTPGLHSRILAWNDDVATNQQEVLDVIDEVIDQIMREQSVSQKEYVP